MDKSDFLGNLKKRLGRGGGETAANVQHPFGEGPPLAATSRELESLSQEDLCERFASEWEAVGGTAEIVSSTAGLDDALASYLAQREGGPVAVSCERCQDLRLQNLAAGAVERSNLDRPLLVAGVPDGAGTRDAAATGEGRIALDPGDRDQLEQLKTIDVGITGCDLAIADTGTLAITARPDRPRALSLFPPCHITIVFASQVVPHLGSALKDLQPAVRSQREFASLHFITGPSKSADVGGQLIHGVHGPGDVHVIMVKEF